MDRSSPGNPPGPGEILGLSGAYWRSLALHAAVRLDLFSLLGVESLTGKEAARRLGGDERGLTTLLNALAAMGLLLKAGEKFSNSSSSHDFLRKGSPRYVGFMIRHHANLVPSWSRLHEAVLSGSPVRGRSGDAGEEALESFLMGMHNSAMGYAPRAVREIDLGGRSRLLDLGGGPGTWSIQFALRHPGLKATVFDLPPSRPYAERTISAFGLSDRVRFHGGDFLEDALPPGFDAAWLSHILHGEGPRDCRRILRSAVSSLDPGGLLMVHEFLLDDDMAGPLFPALFSLNMLTGTAEGRSYTRGQLEEMMAGAGVRDITLLPFRGPTDSRVLAGTVGGSRP